MKKFTTQPVDRARAFKVNQIFFSTTDTRGIIRSCNDVFIEISGYSKEELLGAPHNIIRHPEMPRVVFKYLWDFLLAGNSIAAYVKNMAQDGTYYWVVALALPIDDGFLSIRFKPTSSLFKVVADLYEKLLKIEQRHMPDWKAGMFASEQELISSLASLGFQSYKQFMHTMLQDELKSRDAVLKAENLSLIPDNVGDQGTHMENSSRSLRTYTIARALYDKLDNLFLRLDDYAKLDRILDEKASSVLKYTEGFRFISLNTSVRSSRLGATGAPLAVISDYMRDASTSITSVIGELTELTKFISSEIQSTLFTIASAKLQIEMLLYYSARNLDDSESIGDSVKDPSCDLQSAMSQSVKGIHASLAHLGDKLAGLSVASNQLDKAMTSLQFIQISGLVEAVSIHQSGGFHLIFTEVRERIDEAKVALTELNAAMSQLSRLSVDRKEIGIAFKEYETQLAVI